MAVPDRFVAVRASNFHVTIAAHLFALTTVILLLVWSIHFRGGISLHADLVKDPIINAHPVIMFMGFILVSGQAIMAYSTIRAAKNVQKMVHMLFQLFAISMGIFGIYAAFKFHNEMEIPNMYSLHSWLGMITICLYGLQWLFGFAYFWYPRAPLAARAAAVPWHAFAGVGIFLMAICTAETGLMQKQVEPGTESRVMNFTAIGILLFGFAVCLTATLPRIIAQT